ncbi:MAG: hypothetical protein ABSB11_02440 [Sedimentisphaerales bacterium]|jgi:hypothetical protein
MLNIVIILLILVGITVHRYLSLFWEQGQLPYSIGFLLFVKAFVILYLINFIWMFGLIAGIIVFILTTFQIIYSAGLWIFTFPCTLTIYRTHSLPRVNPFVQNGFSWLVIALALLTIINFIISKYNSMWELLNYNYQMVAIIFAAVLIIGNVARIIIISQLEKE